MQHHWCSILELLSRYRGIAIRLSSDHRLVQYKRESSSRCSAPENWSTQDVNRFGVLEQGAGAEHFQHAQLAATFSATPERIVGSDFFKAHGPLQSGLHPCHTCVLVQAGVIIASPSCRLSCCALGRNLWRPKQLPENAQIHWHNYRCTK